MMLTVDAQVRQALPVPLELLEQQDQQESEDPLDNLDFLELLDHRDQPDSLDLAEIRALLAFEVLYTAAAIFLKAGLWQAL